MPRLDGYQATRRMRQLESSRSQRRTPIIAVTAHTMVGDRESCIESGMDDHIAKPLSLKALRSAIEKWPEQAPCSHAVDNLDNQLAGSCVAPSADAASVALVL